MTGAAAVGPATDPPFDDGHLLPNGVWHKVRADAPRVGTSPADVDWREPEDLDADPDAHPEGS